MLQQILKDMYIDPDVLNALNEDQKKTLFLKMRQEQVRRWKEREEKLERDGGNTESKRTKPKTASSKSVSWLLGRDGDVAVIVIGEVDEFKTSKIICSGFGEKKGPSLHNNAWYYLSGSCEEVSTVLPLQVSLLLCRFFLLSSELKSAEEKSAPQPSICYRPPTRANPVDVRPAGPGPASIRPSLANLQTATPSPVPCSTAKINSGLTSSTKAGLHPQEPQRAQESRGGKDVRVVEASWRAVPEEAGSGGSAATCAGRGRVAQLMKTFSAEGSTPPTQTPSRSNKPPIPNKPNHLRLISTPSVR
ncbi:uncharacterized protein ACN63O_006582 [Diretmus argenteus]